MKQLERDIIGVSGGKCTFTYTWRDLATYAVGIGAKEDELEYQYEKNLKPFPSYGLVPYWGTFNINPPRAIPMPVNKTLNLDDKGSFHMAHKLVVYKPLDVNGAILTFEDVITDVYDRNGKGIVIRSDLTAYDENGEKVFTNIGDTIYGVYEAPGMPAFPKGDLEIPDRAPDFAKADFVAENQHLLYRLSGDTNTIHVDAEVAKSEGFPKPIMQGLCSFGYACRLAIQGFFPGEPERFQSIEAQLRSPLLPGTNVELVAWKVEEGKAIFRLMNSDTGAIVLEKGVIEWKK